VCVCCDVRECVLDSGSVSVIHTYIYISRISVIYIYIYIYIYICVVGLICNKVKIFSKRRYAAQLFLGL
jgi:cellulose synthase/poly-beta-1,6-N-acetylglucosamine synthase-like glycosyltransferase